MQIVELSKPMTDMKNDNFSNVDDSKKIIPLYRVGMTQDTENYYILLKDAEEELYQNCKTFIKHCFIVSLFQLKMINGWNEKLLKMLVILLKRCFPKVKLY